MLPSEARAKTEEAIRSKLPPDMMNTVWKAIEEACNDGLFATYIENLDSTGRMGYCGKVAYLLANKGFKVVGLTYSISVSWYDEEVTKRIE